jgi:Cu-Zn family superoxide dismutase
MRTSVIIISTLLLYILSAFAQDVRQAICVLHPTEDSHVSGIVTFHAIENGVRVVADVRGLTPGNHGIHIHEFGDCSAPDATTAGGHFNPDQKPHGAPTDQDRHVGDLGNLTANAEGVAHFEWLDPLLSFSGPHSILGRAVIIREKEDDLKSQPAGEAGERLACGVIGIAQK